MARKTLIIMSLCVFAYLSAGASETPSAVQLSTAAETSSSQPQNASDINSVISALNYKIELIQGRYISLVNDMNALTASRKELSEGLADQIAQQLKPMQEDISQMSTQIKLIRDEMSQIQEDLGLIMSERKLKKNGKPASN